MEVSVISIGNSKGIRLPKTLIEKYNIKDMVELTLEKGYITISLRPHPGKTGRKHLKKMHENGDDKPLIPDVFDDENWEEWS